MLEGDARPGKEGKSRQRGEGLNGGVGVQIEDARNGPRHQGSIVRAGRLPIA